MLHKKKNNLLHHRIRLDGPYGVEVYQDRLARIYHGNRTVMEGVSPIADESAQIKGFASVLNQLKGDMVIEHPEYGLRLAVNRAVGAVSGYLLSAGAYQSALLRCIHTYIPAGAHVLDIGAGFGISSAVAAAKSGTHVIAVEPNTALHPIIATNAALNQQQTKIVQGCLVPSAEQGDVDFYIVEDVWTSSIYLDKSDALIKQLKVPVCALSSLIKEHQATALILDVQGAELGSLNDVNLTGVDVIIIESHYQLLSGKGVAKVVSSLCSKGFDFVDLVENTLVFKRKS